jgi:hypothetical protein
VLCGCLSRCCAQTFEPEWCKKEIQEEPKGSKKVAWMIEFTLLQSTLKPSSQYLTESIRRQP